MPIFNYGGRNGVSEIIRLTRLLCRIYVRYSSRIVAFINASSLTTEQKATVTAWLADAQEACMLLETVMVTYEK